MSKSKVVKQWKAPGFTMDAADALRWNDVLIDMADKFAETPDVSTDKAHMLYAAAALMYNAHLDLKAKK